MSGSVKNAITNPEASKLLDALLKRQHLKNDAALARLLSVAPPVISKIRNDRLPFGPSLILTALIVTGLTPAEFFNLASPDDQVQK